MLGRNLDLLEGSVKKNQSPADAPKGQSERSGCLVGPKAHLYRGFIAVAQKGRSGYPLSQGNRSAALVRIKMAHELSEKPGRDQRAPLMN